jgi:CDP-diacylglycerol--serine O-phosphatidyltransferase
MCGALRLARFNVQSKRPTDASSKRSFVGLPIPAAAGMLAAVVHFFKTRTLFVGSALMWGLLILLLAFLMISKVRYPSFKEFDVKKARPSLALFVTAMATGLIYFYSEIMLLILMTIYVSSGLVSDLAQTVRRFLPASATHSEPAHTPIKGIVIFVTVLGASVSLWLLSR